MMFCFLIFIYFLCGTGVGLALDEPQEDNNLKRLGVFMLNLLFWPSVFTFGITIAVKEISRLSPFRPKDENS